MAKINLLIALFLFFTFFLTLFFLVVWPEETVEIIFCDVGQGDAILVQYRFTQVLIDAGPNEAVISCLEKHVPVWDKTLEIIVVTHPDLDHIGGFMPVFSRFFVKTVVIEPVIKNTAFFSEFYQTLLEEKRYGTTFLFPKTGDVYAIDSFLEFVVASPLVIPGDKTVFFSQNTETLLSDNSTKNSNDDINYNDLSIALFLKVDEILVGLTGDLEEKGELALVHYGLLDKINILKVGHHGSKTSSTDAFLSSTRPEIFVVSSGKSNKYNHPDPQILEKIRLFSEKIMRTDQVGTIKIVTNGRNYWFSKSPLEEK